MSPVVERSAFGPARFDRVEACCRAAPQFGGRRRDERVDERNATSGAVERTDATRRHRERVTSARREHRDPAVGDGDHEGTTLVGPRRGVEHPLFVPTQIEHEHDVTGFDVDESPRHARRRTLHRDHVGAQQIEVLGKQASGRTGEFARHDEHAVTTVGDQFDGCGELVGVDVVEAATDVLEIGGEHRGEHVTRPALANPLHRRPQLIGHLLLDGELQFDEAGKTQFGGKSHHGRAARTTATGQFGHRSEGDDLRVVEHGLGHTPLGRGQQFRHIGDAVLHGTLVGHGTNRTSWPPVGTDPPGVLSSNRHAPIDRFYGCSVPTTRIDSDRHLRTNELLRAGTAHLTGHEILMVNMTQDEFFPMDGALELFALFDAPKRMHVYEGGHTDIGAEAMAGAVEFLRTNLWKAATP